MKRVFLVMAILISSQTIGKEKMSTRNDITNTFTDTIKNIKENETSLVVQFFRYAVLYKLPKTNAHYNELKIKLEKYKIAEKQIKVTVTIPKMEIKEIVEE